MKKTPGDADARFSEMMRALTPAERLAMACRMFSTGRALAVAGLLSRDQSLSESQLRQALLRHLYGSDFDAERLERVAAGLVVPGERTETDGKTGTAATD